MKGIKNGRLLGCAFAILYLILVAFSFFEIGVSEVVITNTGQKSASANGTDVHISYVAINGIEQKAEQYAGELANDEDEYAVLLKEGDEVTLKLPLFSRCTIKFMKTEDSGYVQMQDCNRKRLMNLAGKDEKAYAHPVTATKGQWAFLIFLLLAVYFIIAELLSILKKNHWGEWLLHMDFLWILLVAIATRIYYWHYFEVPYMVGVDTYTYEFFFWPGYADIRGPVYPLLFEIPRMFTEDAEFVRAFVVYEQVAMGLMGIYLFWKIVRDILPLKGSVFLTLIYANIPMLIIFEHYLMSDSMSVFLMLICIRLVQRFLCRPTGKMSLVVALAVLASVLERSGAIYLIPLLVVFFVLYGFVENKKNIAISALWMLLPVAAILAQCGYNYSTVGKFEISCVPVMYNEGYEVMALGIYDGTRYKDIENRVTEYQMERGSNQWNYLAEVSGEFGAEYTDFIKEAADLNARELTIHRVQKMIGQLSQPITVNAIGEYLTRDLNPVCKVISDDGVWEEKAFNALLCPFTYGTVILLLIFTLAVSFCHWIVNKQIRWLELGLCGILFCTVFITIWNAFSQYPRLTITIVPAVYILLALWIRRVIKDKKGESER